MTPCPACGGSRLTGDGTCAVCGRVSDAPPITTTAHFSPGQAFGPRYKILRLLGVGGMGSVYLAWDEELAVEVALKVIRPEAVADPTTARAVERRFKRELLLARQVTHRNVVRIHDLGEIEGVKYITMTCVDGEDLATMLKREKTLPLSRALDVARQVASGLQAAHDAGVIHRDLKPANIMLDRAGHAVIMDFGIALSSNREAHPTLAAIDGESATTFGTPGRPGPATAPASHGGTALTARGDIVGTPEYMSPEQSAGRRVDHHTDIYAFGLILTEMLTGLRHRRPGSTPWEDMAERVSKAPQSLRVKHPEVTEALDAIILRCLQTDPAERFGTTADLVHALDHLDATGQPIREPLLKRLTPRIVAVAGLLVAVMVVGTWYFSRGSAPPVRPPDPVSVVIADFVNATGDPVFDGFLEQPLAVGVEGASFVALFPRKEALRIATQMVPGGTLDENNAVLVARREGIGRVVSGSLNRTASGFRLDATLIAPDEKGDKRVLRSWTVDAAGKEEVLNAIGKMSANVRAGLGDRSVSVDNPNAGETFTAASLEAARAYVNGQAFQSTGRFEDAIAEYKKSVAIDPVMGRAYAGLGACSANLGRRQEAEGYYKQALQNLNRMTDREKYRTRGGLYLATRNADKAREENLALLEKFPADTAALANLAIAELFRRQTSRAVELGRKALATRPRNVPWSANLALFEMYAGEFAAAERQATLTIGLNKTYAAAYTALALSQLGANRPADAEKTYLALRASSPAAAFDAAIGLADLDMYRGRLAAAATTLDSALAAEKDPSRQGRLMVTLAEVRAMQERPRDAADLAKRAAARADGDDAVAFLAGRVLAVSGQQAAASAIAARLGGRVEPEIAVYAHVLEGEVALARGAGREAVVQFVEAQKIIDSWLGRYGLARAYVAAGAFPEADSEVDRCMQRRGEATAVLLDDVPTYHLLPPIHYYEGRVQEALNSTSAADAYRSFVAIKAGGDEQGLVADARRRLGGKRP